MKDCSRRNEVRASTVVATLEPSECLTCPIWVALIPTNANKWEVLQRCTKQPVKLYTHQRPRSRCGLSLDLSHITRTIRPSSLASGPGSAGPGGGGGGGARDAGMGGGTSMDSLHQPAFWRFAGVGVVGGGGLGACAHTLAIKSAS